MKNNLNKLTHQNDDFRLSDVQPSKEPMPQPESRGFRSQFLFNLFTLFLIFAALAFPYAITGAFSDAPYLSALISGNAETETTAVSLDGAVTDATSTSRDAETGAPDTSASAISDIGSETGSMPLLDGPESESVDGLDYPRVSIVSSDIVSVGHNPDSKMLFVEFKSGRIYRYADVPEKVYKGLMKAESHGTFFDEKIKNAGYEFEKLK